MKISAKYIYIGGGLLIFLTNIFALGGVAWNRQGTPTTLMKLSERELRLPYYSDHELKENSGIDLRLLWDTADVPGRHGRHFKGIGKRDSECNPGFLDSEKLKSLGFDVSQSVDTVEGKRRLDKQLSKEVFFVLELAGPSWYRAIEEAKKKLAEAKTVERGKTINRTDIEYQKSMLDQVEHSDSRLYLIDAGLDEKALRSRYPDRSQYLIVRGTVGTGYFNCGEKNEYTVIRGWAGTLTVTEVNVPYRFRHQFEPFRKSSGSANADDERRAHPYEVTVAFGRRFEPWIKDIVWKSPPSGEKK